MEMPPLPPLLARPLDLARVDLAPRHRQPGTAAVIVATLVAIGGSLLADAIVVAVGESLFPSTVGYVHFRFFDYATLTIIGVLIASAGWPIVTRISSDPRWLFSRLAVAVSAVLFLPDAYLVWAGQSPKAVGVLAVMHVAIAVVTYQALVRVSPATSGRRLRRPAQNRPRANRGWLIRRG